jgi:probable lipoprotein NlpC
MKRWREFAWRGGIRCHWALVALALCLVFGVSAFAEAPVLVAAPKKARASLVEKARLYLGTPYLYGGSSSKGMDCSGLVYRVYLDTFGVAPLSSLPRTARDLFAFVEPLERKDLQPGDLVFFDTTGKLSHVGIFEGDGLFIHAASDGPDTGVIESSLSESYWSKHYAGCGRIIPPAEYLGIAVSAALGPAVGMDPVFRGMAIDFRASYRILGLEVGLALRPSWDPGLGVARLPLVLSLSLDRRLSFFAGPALTLGTPALAAEGATTAFEAQGGFLATIGAVWKPLTFRLAGQDFYLYTEVVYDRYVSQSGIKDLDAQLRAGAGIGMRWSF